MAYFFVHKLIYLLFLEYKVVDPSCVFFLKKIIDFIIIAMIKLNPFKFFTCFDSRIPSEMSNLIPRKSWIKIYFWICIVLFNDKIKIWCMPSSFLAYHLGIQYLVSTLLWIVLHTKLPFSFPSTIFPNSFSIFIFFVTNFYISKHFIQSLPITPLVRHPCTYLP